MGKQFEIKDGQKIVVGTIKLVNGKRVTVPCRPYDFTTKEYVDLT